MIDIRSISKQWGSTTALHPIDLHVASQSFCVLLGPSGCGKSTTLRIIAGLEQPSTGQVLLNGQDVTHLPPARRGIAMVFQNYALFPHLTVAENIGFGLSVRKTPKAERLQRMQQAAELLGLEHLLARKPGQLSGGQQQRVALGRALVSQAQVCLMDEPLSNLDAQLRQEMRHELRELQQRLGLTVVYVTHDQAEAMSMADQVVLLNQGRIEQDAAARTVYAQPASAFAARFIGTPPMNLLRLDAQGRIAGSDLAPHAPQGAAHLGIRPETIRLVTPAAPLHTEREWPMDVVIASQEYLGADLVLRAAIGTELITLRAAGHMQALPGEPLQLGIAHADCHFFDAAGQRLHRTDSPSQTTASAVAMRAAA